MRPVACAGDAQGDQGDFGADAGEAHPFGGGNDLDDLRGELFMEGRFGGADDAELDPVDDRFFDRRVVVTEHRRAVRQVEVDQAATVDIVEIGAFATLDEERSCQDRD